MVDIGKQIAYWRAGAEEDWSVAQELVAAGRIRHGLFFGHLALEKILKAHVCRSTGELAPPIHNLIRLAERAEVALTGEQSELLAEVNEFNIEGRYPHSLVPAPTPVEAEEYLARMREVLECLNRQF